MSRPLPRLMAALVLGALALGCAQETGFVQVRERSAQPLVLSRIAVAPFLRAQRSGAAAVPADAAPLLGGYVADALATRGLDVVPPSDVAGGLGLGSGQALAPAEVAAAAHRKFGADAIAIGTVYRFRDRSGEALGSTHPASVGFEVKILSAPGGALLWSGAFDETQVALGENLLRAPQYPGGGTRWLTAEEFARWGAGRLAAVVPLAAP